MNPLDEIIIRLNRTLETHHVTESSVFETKEVTPSMYISKYFEKELNVLYHLSKVRITSILPLLLTQTDSMLKNNINQKDWKFQTIFTLSLYYHIGTMCCKNLPITDSVEVTDDYINMFVLNQSLIIFNNDFSGYGKYLRGFFKKFLTMLSSHSVRIYKCFCDDLKTTISSKSTFTTHMVSVQYLVDSIQRISRMINGLLGFSQDVGEKNRKSFCLMVRNIIINACKNDLNGFICFLSKKKDISKASILFSQIEEWSKNKKELQVEFLSAQLALLILQPSRLSIQGEIQKGMFVDKLIQFVDMKGKSKEAALTTILYGLKFYRLSHGHEVILNFISDFFQPLINYYIVNKHNMV